MFKKIKIKRFYIKKLKNLLKIKITKQELNYIKSS